jgi:hypothetical protein
MARHRSPLFAALAAALALALALLFFARPASAAVIIQRYALDVVAPAADSEDATYTLTLTYRAQGERKDTGFKFVGSYPPKSLWVTDDKGKPLSRNSSLEGASGEYRIDFDLPSPDARGLQTVKIGFVQRLSSHYGWGEREATIPWAPTFRVPVTTMEVTITGSEDLSAPSDFACDKGMRVTCSRTSSGTRSVRFNLPHEDSGGSLAVMIAMFFLAAGGLALVVRFRHKKLLSLVGIIPPASEVAYPEGARGYRAPPPLPVMEEVKPVLPEEERSKFVMRVSVGVTVLLALLALLAVTVSGRASAPMPVVLSVVTVVGALITWPFLITEKTNPWTLAALVMGSFGLLFSGAFFGMAIGLMPLMGWGISAMPKGTGGSSGGGSSCSSSSCGGGGGGCGGGGGGGGCGG